MGNEPHPNPAGSTDAADRARGDLTPGDPVEALRDELPEIRTLPVQDRVERFEHANEVLASALAELDEV